MMTASDDARYWMTEALPLPITSMLPMVGLPLLGLMSTGQVTFHNICYIYYIYISISTYLHRLPSTT